MARTAKKELPVKIKTIWLKGETEAYGQKFMTRRKLTVYTGNGGTIYCKDSIIQTSREDFLSIWNEFKMMKGFSCSVKEIFIKFEDVSEIMKKNILAIRPIRDSRQKELAKLHNSEIKALIAALRKIL